MRCANSITVFCDYDEPCSIYVEQAGLEIAFAENVCLKSGYTILMTSGTEGVVIKVELSGKQYIARL